MNRSLKKDKITGQGVGYPGPASVEMVKRVSTPSSSDDRGMRLVGDQANASDVTGKRIDPEIKKDLLVNRNMEQHEESMQDVEILQICDTEYSEMERGANTDKEDPYIKNVPAPFRRSSLINRSPTRIGSPIEINREMNNEANKTTTINNTTTPINSTTTPINIQPGDERSKRKRNADKRSLKDIDKETTSDDVFSKSDMSEEENRRGVKKISRRSTPPNKKQLKLDKQSRAEIHGFDKEDLHTVIQENARAVEAVAAKSSNLKGGCIKEFKEAASRIRVAAFALYNSVQTGSTDDRAQIKNLKDRLKRIEEENKNILAENELLKSQLRNKNEELNIIRKETDKTGYESNTDIIQRINTDVQGLTRTIIEEMRNIIPKMVTEAVDERMKITKNDDGRKRQDTIEEDIEVFTYEEQGDNINHKSNEKRKSYADTVRSSNRVRNRNSTYSEYMDIDTYITNNQEQEWELTQRRKRYDRRQTNNSANSIHANSKNNNENNVRQSSKINDKQTNNDNNKYNSNKRNSTKEKRGKKVPIYNKIAVISVTIKNNKMTYEHFMHYAKNKIDLKELDISDIRVKRSLGGNLVLQIFGEDNKTKATRLAEELNRIFIDNKDDVTIRCPEKMKELLISNLEDGVTYEEIKQKLNETMKTNEQNMIFGNIKRSDGRLATIWLKCPAVLADKLVELKRIRIGWNMANIIPLKQRPLQCFRCWGFGHARDKCNNTTDRAGRCYICCNEGHSPMSCKKENVICILCRERGLDDNHRMGNNVCTVYRETIRNEDNKLNKRRQDDQIGRKQ